MAINVKPNTYYYTQTSCERCGGPLVFSGYVHCQNICWSCYKETLQNILMKLDGDERKVLVSIANIIAEIHDEEF